MKLSRKVEDVYNGINEKRQKMTEGNTRTMRREGGHVGVERCEPIEILALAGLWIIGFCGLFRRHVEDSGGSVRSIRCE